MAGCPAPKTRMANLARCDEMGAAWRCDHAIWVLFGVLFGVLRLLASMPRKCQWQWELPNLQRTAMYSPKSCHGQLLMPQKTPCKEIRNPKSLNMLQWLQTWLNTVGYKRLGETRGWCCSMFSEAAAVNEICEATVSVRLENGAAMVPWCPMMSHGPWSPFADRSIFAGNLLVSCVSVVVGRITR